jgi:hypothetical protein
MEIRIRGMKQLAMRVLSSCSNHGEQVAQSDVETLTSYLRDVGEDEDGMSLEEIACIVLLYEIQREKAQDNAPPKKDPPLLSIRRGV